MNKIVTTIMALTISATVTAANTKPLVSIGNNGKLQYATDKQGNRMPDFSRCGYMGGGVSIPDLPVRKTLLPLEGTADDTARIQKAIDELSKLKLDGSGYRGALLLKRGTYRVEGNLRLKASGIVLRGEGQGTNGTILIATGIKQRTLIGVAGSKKITEVEGSRRKIADAHVPWGVQSFNLESAKGLSVGDPVILLRPASKEWIHDIRMDRIPSRKKRVPRQWTAEEYIFRFERVVTAVKGKKITLDAPVVNSMDQKYGGGFVYRYTDTGRISQVGIEHLRLVSEYDKAKKHNNRGTLNDEAHAWTGVGFWNVSNGWARNVTAVHFGWGAVKVSGGAKFVTVQDCSYLKPVARMTGGRRYPFSVSGQFSLVQRCYSEGGRHCNVADAKSCGPNVYLDIHNVDGDSGPHHRWAMGVLYDNLKTPEFLSHDRAWMGSGHGWTGAQMVYWNCDAQYMNIQRPPTGELYVIGCKAKGNTKNGYFESHGTPVKPRSLYLKQLEDRLGMKAVKNVTTEAQRKGTIYEVLKKELGR